VSVDYSDSRFDAALDEIESLLGDLYGIEAVAQAVLDFAYKNPDEVQGPKTNIPLTLRASTPFEVYPVLPSADMDPAATYQPWVDSVFENGKLKAAGTRAWLKAVADNYYLVDAEAITSAAQQQMELAHNVGVQIDQDFIDLSGNLSVHWEGDAKEAMFEWFAAASAVVSILMIYADSAQLSAGAAGDAIGATQQLMLRHAENGRDALEEAVAAWRNDNDVFPFPPGSGFLFKQIGSAISEHIDEYTDKLPGVGELAAKALIGKVVKKLPYSKQVIGGYKILKALEAKDTDEKTPESADQLITAIEDGLRGIVAEGDQAVEKLSDKIKALADQVAGDPVLVLPRLPRSPGGSYTGDAG
jgi:hypothetical protein